MVTVATQGVEVVVYDLHERLKYASTAYLYAFDRLNRSAAIDAYVISKLQHSVMSAVKLDRRYAPVKSDIVSYPDCSSAMYPYRTQHFHSEADLIAAPGLEPGIDPAQNRRHWRRRISHSHKNADDTGHLRSQQVAKGSRTSHTARRLSIGPVITAIRRLLL